MLWIFSAVRLLNSSTSPSIATNMSFSSIKSGCQPPQTCLDASRAIPSTSPGPLVIKDSWQYLEHEEEGELLREATDKGVVNVA